jgi:hypothetical protein
VGDLLGQMALYGLAAAAAAPVGLVVSCLILAESKRPVLSVVVFTAGAASLVATFVVIVYVVYDEESASGGHNLSAILGTFLWAVFIVLAVLAIFSDENPVKEEKRRLRAESVASSTPAKLFALGLLAQAINFDAIAIIGSGVKQAAVADVSTAAVATALLVGLALAFILYYGPAVLYVLSPQQAGPILRVTSQWLIRQAKPVGVVVFFVIGAIFLWHGIADFQ